MSSYFYLNPDFICVGLHYILDSEERKRIAGSGNIRYCYCAEQNKTEETTTCYG